MIFDTKSPAMANIAVQVLLLFLLFAAVYLAKKKRFDKHCTVIRIAVLVQIIAIIAVMLPSLPGYLKSEHFGILFESEALIHHASGLLVIVLWIYINLMFGKVIGMPRKPALFMRTAFILWMLAFLLGLHMYARIYL